VQRGPQPVGGFPRDHRADVAAAIDDDLLVALFAGDQLESATPA